MHQAAAVVEVARVLGHHPGHPFVPGEVGERIGERGLVPPRLVPLHLDGDPPAERLAPARELPRGGSGGALAHQRGEPPGAGPGEQVEAGAPFRHVGPAHARPPARHVRRLARPAAQVGHAGAGHQRGEVAVALAAPHQEGERPPVHLDLRAGDGPDPRLLRRRGEPRDAAEVGGVGEADGGIAERRRARGERLGRHGAVAEREGAVGAELDVCRSRSLAALGMTAHRSG